MALDGLQPEKGHDTLSLLRALQSRRVLVARHLLASARADRATLIEEVLALGVAVVGVVSDQQESWGLAMARPLPGVPHQCCHFPSLRDAALPVCAAERTLQKAVRQKGRGVREVERRVATQQTTAAGVGRE